VALAETPGSAGYAPGGGAMKDKGLN
jgi:hypothetical protein